MRRVVVALVFSVILAVSSDKLSAETKSMTAYISFETALNIEKSKDISFGLVKAEQAGTYSISANGKITAENGGVWVGGATQAGSVTISGSSTQTIDISATNYTQDKGSIPSQAVCSYDKGATAPCILVGQSPPGQGKDLLIGVTVTVDGSQKIGEVAAPSFDIVVSYH